MDNTERFKVLTGVYLVLRRDDQILLIRRTNTGYQDGKYNLVTGHMEGDELATTTAAREAKEEVGITIDPRGLKLVHTMHRLRRGEPGMERIELFFEATSWEGEPSNTEPEKCDDVSWHPLNSLPDNTATYIKLVLHDIANGVTYSEYESGPA